MTVAELYNTLRKVRFGEQHDDNLLAMCEQNIPIINEINRLKKEQNAVILAHSYVKSNIIYSVADFSGDSYGLSKDAMSVDADKIIFAAVRFMGETAKILNPSKEVLIPGEESGCSLADSITGEDVRRLKAENPDFAFICYINTTADVKAECDVCVTSSNVFDIVEKYPSDKIFFVPDTLMGKNIMEEMDRRGVKKEIKLWGGTCYVHEEYKPEMISDLRDKFHDLKVMVHPECTPAVLHEADFAGSTGQLLDFIKNDSSQNYLMLTECGLISRIEVEVPEKHFVGACTLCKYMKSNSLENILRVLQNPEEKDYVRIDSKVIDGAKRCIDNMFKYAE